MEGLSLLTNYKPPRKILRSYEQYQMGASKGKLGSSHTFKLPKNHGRLVQQFLEIKITPSVTDGTITVISPFGSSICKSIYLCSSSGIIQELTSQLIESRIALLTGSPLFGKIESGMADELEDGVETTVTLPLMWFFSDSGFLTTATDNNNQYSVKISVNDSVNEMGMRPSMPDEELTITNLSFKLISLFDQVEVEQMAITKTPSSGYSVFKEDVSELITGQTSATVLLRCPYKVFALHFLIRYDIGTEDVEINRVIIDSPRGMILDVNQHTNYTMSSSANSDLENSNDYSTSFSIKYGNRNSGYDTDEYITFDDSMMPTHATVHFDAINGPAKLYILSEHHTKIIEENGMVTAIG